jgi:serine/threonine protein kinase/tetratricopeptide (TPR) repeat protein
MTEDAQRLQALFAAAVELPPTQRAQMLARECADDPQLLAELESLLDSDARFCGTTAQPIASGLTELIPSVAPHALTGQRVGSYELREEIGHGGMGTVYRAERVDGSVTQQVAIKFVRRELLDALTLKRFQLERQVMATLKHPNIARLLDASQLDDGTPYYVMEYVDGIAITEYSDRARLDVRERVNLLRKVCGAVAEAHRELVVHRDLKPGNILVDSSGNPKLLDFGIAKPLHAASTTDHEDTGTAHRFFSPQYAAPEQLEGARVGVACDVYALGLLLYELLAGCRPFELAGLSAGQAERLIKEVPPSAPSNRLARDSVTGIQARQLRGDLDGIVMRCLRKSPSDRYASVEQLEADLENYLSGRPVQARGGHRWYRAQKFVLRNKLAVSAGLLLSLSLVGGAAAFALEAHIANRRAAELEQVSKFQADMLEQIDPPRAGQLLSSGIKAQYAQALARAEVPDAERANLIAAFDKQWQDINATDAARELIDGALVKPAVTAIDAKFKDQPPVDASLSEVLGERYLDWGLFDAAQPLLERALATRRRELGVDDPATLQSLDAMGVLLQGRGKFAKAEDALRDALERRTRVLGAEHRDTLTTMNELAEVLALLGKLDEAERLVRQSLESHRRTIGMDDRGSLIALNELGFVLRQEGKLSEAEPLFRQSLEGRRRVLGPDHPLTLVAANSLAEVLRAQGKSTEAEAYLRADLETSRRIHGELHQETLKMINAMGAVSFDLGKQAEAEAYYRDALEKSRRVLGPDNSDTLVYASNVAGVLVQQGKISEAEPYLLDVLERRRRIFGPESSEALKSSIRLATLWQHQHRSAEVIKLLVPLESLSRQMFSGGNIYYLAKLQMLLGRAYAETGDFAAAEAELRDSAANLAVDPKNDDGDKADGAASFAMLYARWDKTEPGKGYRAKAVESARKAHELDPKLPPIEVDGVKVE